MAEPWVSVDAAHVGASMDNVYDRWHASRALPAHRAGRVWRFKVSKDDAWVRADGANELADKAAS